MWNFTDDQSQASTSKRRFSGNQYRGREALMFSLGRQQAALGLELIPRFDSLQRHRGFGETRFNISPLRYQNFQDDTISGLLQCPHFHGSCPLLIIRLGPIRGSQLAVRDWIFPTVKGIALPTVPYEMA
ncbi:molybdate ABC transporter [Striga asiatica]|uniref:Molybdate ABC transporter n=1 Tax=Striga asiatica TaxID=4170 RepID=A0A5A7Q054_STRAF|nr:molybdate ABC transporter [Striga asiatica]